MPSEVRIHYPRRRAIRWVLRRIIRTSLQSISNFKIEGQENLPAQGPALIVANHFSFLDPVAMIDVVSQPLEFFAGLRTPNAPAWSEIFPKLWGVLRVRRGGSSRDSVLNGELVLKQGGLLCIFPEGGSWASVLRPPRMGAALVAARVNAPIVPVGFDGLLDVFPFLKRHRRASVTVRIGKPFGPFSVEGRANMRQRLAEIGHEIMCAIAPLVPPERRGFYSDDPAIREAAKGSEIYPWEGLMEE